MKSYFTKLCISFFFLFISLFGNLKAQNDTIYFKPVHEGLQIGTMFFGFSAMSPAYSFSSQEKSFYLQNDFLMRFGYFIENKFCFGTSLMITDYINRNDVTENMYLFGGFTRLYQRNGSFNYFIKLAVNIGNKKYVINDLNEIVDNKKNFMFGPGLTWIDKNIMFEFSANVNYLIHYNFDVNTNTETTKNKIYLQPAVGINFYF